MSTVKTFTLPRINCIHKSKIDEFKIDEFYELRIRGDEARALLEEPYKKDAKNFIKITKEFVPDILIKKSLNSRYGIKNITNAWLKLYEIINRFDLIPAIGDTFVHLDNAAFPGAWILATHHYITTKTDRKYEWYASSLLDQTKDNKGPLTDVYGLYRTYPENWLMSDKNNGDVTVYENQLLFYQRLPGVVDFYSSDIGFDVSIDYKQEEKIHSQANLGQIVTGLLVLKSGGHMVTKQFSFMTPFLISLMGLLTLLFDSVVICKPSTSRARNSETYLVCKGYNCVESIRNTLLDRIRNFNYDSFVDKECLGDLFMSKIIEAQTFFIESQINTLKIVINEYNRIKGNKKISKFVKINEDIKNKWFIHNPISKIPASKKINTN